MKSFAHSTNCEKFDLKPPIERQIIKYTDNDTQLRPFKRTITRKTHSSKHREKSPLKTIKIQTECIIWLVFEDFAWTEGGLWTLILNPLFWRCVVVYFHTSMEPSLMRFSTRLYNDRDT